MNNRTRLIAGGAFLLLAIALFVVLKVVDFSGEEAEATPETETPGVLFPDAETSVVSWVAITDRATGQTFSVSLDDDVVWQVEETPGDVDPGLELDQSLVTTTLAALPVLRPSRVLNEIEALAPFGLEDAQYEIRFRVVGGDGEFALFIGTSTPTNTGYYVRLTESSGITEPVYLVSGFDIDSVLTLLNNPPFVEPTPEPDTSS